MSIAIEPRPVWTSRRWTSALRCVRRARPMMTRLCKQGRVDTALPIFGGWSMRQMLQEASPFWAVSTRRRSETAQGYQTGLQSAVCSVCAVSYTERHVCDICDKSRVFLISEQNTLNDGALSFVALHSSCSCGTLLWSTV